MASTHSTDEPQTVTHQKVRALLEGFQIAMLTTVSGDRRLHSRPMAVQQAAYDGELWFLTSDETHKAAEIARNPFVALAFANEGRSTYVSLSGRAELTRNREKLEELWTPLNAAWFPEGIDDPHLVLLRVVIDSGEYWDAPAGRMVQFAQIVKAAITGQRLTTDAADHGTFFE